MVNTNKYEAQCLLTVVVFGAFMVFVIIGAAVGFSLGIIL